MNGKKRSDAKNASLDKVEEGRRQKERKKRRKSKEKRGTGISGNVEDFRGERSSSQITEVEVHGGRGDVGAGQSENWSRGKGLFSQPNWRRFLLWKHNKTCGARQT